MPGTALSSGRYGGYVSGVASGSREAPAWVLLFLSIALYYYDWMNQFNGIGLASIVESPSILFRGGILILAIIFFAYQYFTQQEKTREDIESMAAVSFVFAAIVFFGRSNPVAILHIIFGIIVWAVLLRGNPRMNNASANKTFLLILFLDLFLFSMIEYLAAFNSIMTAATIAYRFIFPIYPLYLIYYLNTEEKSSIAPYLIIALVFVYAVGFIQTNPEFQLEMSEISSEQQEQTIEWAERAGEKASDASASFFDPWRCIQDIGTPRYKECLESLQYSRQCEAEGFEKDSVEYNDCIKEKSDSEGTAAGTADKEIKHYTKVEFKKPKQYKVSAGFSEKIDIEIFIDSKEDTLNIENSCSIKKGSKNIKGQVISGKFLEDVKGVETHTIQCLSSENFSKGKHYVDFSAKIMGIETSSTRQKIWTSKNMDEEDEKNILKSHSLAEIEPRSKHEDEFAALAISIGPDNSIMSNTKTTQIMRARIQNLKDGKIKDINHIRIELPAGVVPLDDCFERLESEKEGLKVKKEIIEQRMESINNMDKDDLLTIFSCSLDVSNLINPADHEIRTFISYLDYDYEISEKTGIEAI